MDLLQIIHVISVAIAILQNLVPVYDVLDTLIQKFELLDRVMLFLVKQFNLLLDDGLEVSGELFGFFVVVESLKIVKVSAELRTCIFSLVLMILESFHFFLKLLASMRYPIVIPPFLKA